MVTEPIISIDFNDGQNLEKNVSVGDRVVYGDIAFGAYATARLHPADLASLWQYVFPQLSCEKVGKHPYTRVVATMGVAKDPKIRAMFRRHIKRPDQRFVALAQIAGKTREAEAFANRG
jgi:hypothetical protein